MLDRKFCSRLVDWVTSRSSDHGNGSLNRIFARLCSFIRRCIFSILSAGPLPNHIAFILDGNRRYARKHGLKEGDGHRVGFLALMWLLKYCYELKIKYVTVYAFSIDNFKRRPEEVESLMELMQEKVEGLLEGESVVMEYGVRVHFAGDLGLLSDGVRASMDRVTMASAGNAEAVLVVCVAYTSTHEIANAVQESFREERGHVDLGDVERHMYMGVAPDVDILIRSSGETRLSNFLLWQTDTCLLYCPSSLWPELGLRHLLWSVFNFQRHHSYLHKKRKRA